MHLVLLARVFRGTSPTTVLVKALDLPIPPAVGLEIVIDGVRLEITRLAVYVAAEGKTTVEATCRFEPHDHILTARTAGWEPSA